MGTLTNDMRRLRGEIDAMHNRRSDWIRDLRRAISTDLAGVHRVWFGPALDEPHTVKQAAKSECRRMEKEHRSLRGSRPPGK